MQTTSDLQTIELVKGGHYSAQIMLTGISQFVSNQTVETRLKSAGFIGVKVTGSGKNRSAIGIWNGETQSFTGVAPKEIVSVTKI